MTNLMSDRPSLRLFVFKEGILSRLGHDLRLALTRFEITLDAGAIEARFETSSIRVEGAMKRGVLDENGLSKRDRAKVEATVREQILMTRKYPDAVLEASFESKGDCAEVRGALTLLGRRRALEPIRLVPSGEVVIAKTTLTPTRWGIAPYRGLAGALKIQDRIDVEISIPADLDLNAPGARQWKVDA